MLGFFNLFANIQSSSVSRSIDSSLEVCIRGKMCGLKKDLYFLEAKLINRYNRKYFLSANGCYRITLDFNIHFYPVRPFPSAFFKNTTCEPYSVLELKYKHINDNEAQKITSHLPFRLAKSSKYVSGVYKLYFFSS